MNKNLTFRNISNKSTKAFQGGTAQEQEQFELNLQLHAGVSNPYTFKITKNYKASADTKAAIPPYTEKSWTTPGTYTWTVPNGVTKVRVAVCGGGGGGGATSNISSRTGGTGGSSSFNNTISASGGKGGYARMDMDDYTSNITYSYDGGAGGTPNGRKGSSGFGNSHSGGTGFNLSFDMTNGTYGQGGSASRSVNSGGGSGGYYTDFSDVISSQNYNIVVGNGGMVVVMMLLQIKALPVLF